MNRVATSAVALIALAGVAATATPAEAATVKVRAYYVARSHAGDPYHYGSAGPNRFDCSGLVYFAYRRVGKTLPRTAQSQYDHTRHVGKYGVQVGDLVFFGASTRSISHVGIYAGHGEIWNANSAPYRGYRVVLAPIREYTYGGKRTYYGQVR